MIAIAIAPRPLVVTDCDEVLLHMVRHFREWLDAEHDIDFALRGDPFLQAMRRRDSAQAMAEEEVWGLLNLFFDTQMHVQQPIEGALAAIQELQRDADVVVLTNLMDHRNEPRVRQLRDLGIAAPVFTNQGPKGAALRRIERNTALSARCSSTISPSIMSQQPKRCRACAACTSAGSPRSRRTFPAR